MIDVFDDRRSMFSSKKIKAKRFLTKSRIISEKERSLYYNRLV